MRFHRRSVLVLGLAGSAALVLWFARRRRASGFRPTLEEAASAAAWLREHPVIDAHAHPGRTFVRGASKLSLPLRLYAALGTFEERTIRDMVTGGLGAAVFAAVSDFPVLGLSRSGLRPVREFDRGEALRSYQTQMRNLHALAARGLIRLAEDHAALTQAGANARPAAILGVEGGDFLEGKPERVKRAWEDGVRVIALVHYRPNELGDVQTEEARSGGLTEAGRAVVREMNRLGILVDIAHASEATARGVLDVSTKPVLLSHTHVYRENSAPRSFPENRFVSLGLARDVAASGGLIGAWPAGIGISDLEGFARRIAELVVAVGIDHVGLGTDMDANFRPVLRTYADLPLLLITLRRAGFSDSELLKVLRANFIRLFARK